MQNRLDDRLSPRDQALQALGALAGSSHGAPIAVTAPGQPARLDMQHSGWPQAMIDHIDALRDVANASSTRLTLVPDALGKIDLSVRHDGNNIYVHFAADKAETRSLLVDAQPRLAELAQARGLRLGQSTIDAGTGGGQQRHQQPHAAPPPPPRPTSAFTAATARKTAADPMRLA